MRPGQSFWLPLGIEGAIPGGFMLRRVTANMRNTRPFIRLARSSAASNRVPEVRRFAGTAAIARNGSTLFGERDYPETLAVNRS